MDSSRVIGMLGSEIGLSGRDVKLRRSTITGENILLYGFTMHAKFFNMMVGRDNSNFALC